MINVWSLEVKLLSMSMGKPTSIKNEKKNASSLMPKIDQSMNGLSHHLSHQQSQEKGPISPIWMEWMSHLHIATPFTAYGINRDACMRPPLHSHREYGTLVLVIADGPSGQTPSNHTFSLCPVINSLHLSEKCFWWDKDEAFCFCTFYWRVLRTIALIFLMT